MADTNLKNEKTYDLVFWTSISKHTRFLIPLINEAFGENISEAADIRLLPGKQATMKNDESIEEGEMDVLAEISDPKSGYCGRKYHFELESKSGKTIAIRLAEYGAAHAYDSITWSGVSAEMTIPHAAVIFLRSDESTPKSFTITIRYPGGRVSYETPVLKMHDYTIEEIFRKKLLLLLPYIPFLFEGRFKRMNNKEGKLDDIREALDEVITGLEKLCSEGKINETEKQHMIDWLKRVFDKLTIKYKKVRKGVDEIMGEYILHTRTDDILDQGIQQGMQQGIQQGMKQGMQQGRKESAIRMSEDGLSVEKIARYVDESVETVRGWISSVSVTA